MMTSKLSYLFFAFVFITNAHAYGLKMRKEIDCAELNPEMASWYQQSLNKKPDQISSAPIDRILGPIKHQKVGWCFAFSAADMLSQASGYNISGAHVAKNFYTKGYFTWLKQSKEGGDIGDALDLNLETPLCDENEYSSNEITNFNQAQKKNCIRSATTLYNYKVKSKKATGYFDGYVLYDFLDSILKDGRIAGIHYDYSQLFSDRKSNGNIVKSDHASTIVSRYFDKKASACRYIIRNTYGDTCSAINTNQTSCVKGYYSITEQKLTGMLLEVISLKAK